MATPPPGTTPTMIVAAGFINGAVRGRSPRPPTLRAVLATESTPTSHGLPLHSAGARRDGFWNSNLANVVQVAPMASHSPGKVFHDRFCTDPAHPSMLEKFLLGGTAGAVAMTAVYPMYVVQNRRPQRHPAVTTA